MTTNVILEVGESECVKFDDVPVIRTRRLHVKILAH